ncbi:DUF1804 family protein [Salmonella enterica]|nr:DUF1804 family protein [Salmonella enterica]
MAYSKDDRARFRRAYIFSQLSLELTAAQFGISSPTALRWKRDAQKNGDDWDKLRAANALAGGGMEEAGRAVLMALVVQCQATMEKINADPDLTAEKRVEMLASLSDAFNKAVAASKKILPETDKLAIAISVLHLFGEHINQKYPKLRADFIEVLETFQGVVEDEFG